MEISGVNGTTFSGDGTTIASPNGTTYTVTGGGGGDAQPRMRVLTKELEEGSSLVQLDCSEGYIIERVIFGYQVTSDGTYYPCTTMNVRNNTKARIQFLDYPEEAVTAVAIVLETPQSE